jgi:hypothetical protein
LVLMVLWMSWREGEVVETRMRKGRNIWKRPAETATKNTTPAITAHRRPEPFACPFVPFAM